MDMNSNGALRRGLTALFVEHRVPYVLRGPIDRACRAMGLKTRVLELDGFKFKVRRLTSDESFVANVVGKREYTPAGYEVGVNDTVIDIGGNIGTFAVTAAKAARAGRVLAFEPSRPNFNLLNENLKLNDVKNVETYCVAVSDRVGSAAFYSYDDEGGHNTLTPGKLGPMERVDMVPTVPLALILDQYKVRVCDLMKMDCEGAEYEIFAALPDAYWPRIRRLSMEFHGKDIEEARVKVAVLVKQLEAHGFRIDSFEEHPAFRCGHLRATNTRAA